MALTWPFCFFVRRSGAFLADRNRFKRFFVSNDRSGRCSVVRHRSACVGWLHVDKSRVNNAIFSSSSSSISRVGRHFYLNSSAILFYIFRVW